MNTERVQCTACGMRFNNYHSPDECDAAQSIGGTHHVRTERGFSIYGEVTDDRGNVTRVQRSSAVGEPCCYVFTKDRDGNDVHHNIVGVMGGAISVSPHLTREQARELAAILQRFADEP